MSLFRFSSIRSEFSDTFLLFPVSLSRSLSLNSECVSLSVYSVYKYDDHIPLCVCVLAFLVDFPLWTQPVFYLTQPGSQAVSQFIVSYRIISFWYHIVSYRIVYRIILYRTITVHISSFLLSLFSSIFMIYRCE